MSMEGYSPDLQAASCDSMALPAAAPTLAEDAALMLAYAAGDASAFERLYARHRQGLYGFLHRQCPRTAWVDDLFQETWLSVVKVWADYRPTASFKTWLYGIARNKLIDRLRLSEPALLADLLDATDDDPMERLPAAPSADPSLTLANRQLGQTLEQALRSLPAAQREVFLLREQAEMDLDEIAALTGVPAETAKSRLRYAVAKLKSVLAGVA